MPWLPALCWSASVAIPVQQPSPAKPFAASCGSFAQAIKELERANIAPVDVAQAAIGPGMSIFSQAKQFLTLTTHQ